MLIRPVVLPAQLSYEILRMNSFTQSHHCPISFIPKLQEGPLGRDHCCSIFLQHSSVPPTHKYKTQPQIKLLVQPQTADEAEF